jgi:hypothetical protein
MGWELFAITIAICEGSTVFMPYNDIDCTVIRMRMVWCFTCNPSSMAMGSSLIYRIGILRECCMCMPVIAAGARHAVIQGGM